MIDAEINNYADNIRNSLCSSIPINVFTICGNLNICIQEENIKSEGYLICENGKSTIIVKKSSDYHRKTFSIAHELGHFFLPEHSKSIFGCTYEDMSFKTKKGLEIEANKFASQLLMPKQFIKEEIKGDIDLNFICEEATKFNVSLSAMAIRLTQLAYETMAVFYIDNEIIKWAIKSDDFEFTLTRGRVSKNSIAYLLFEEKKYQKKTSKVPPEAWIEDPKIEDLYEESIFFPNYNSVLSIIHYNPEDVELIEEGRD